MRVVRLLHAEGCHLCEEARAVVEAVRRELPFELVLVDIAADPALERDYRERIPVVEVDGEPVFTYFVDPAGLREALRGNLRPFR